MTDIINLNKARKAKAKQGKKVKAAENRVRFGTPAGIREGQRKEEKRSVTVFEAHRVERQEGEEKKVDY